MRVIKPDNETLVDGINYIIFGKWCHTFLRRVQNGEMMPCTKTRDAL